MRCLTPAAARLATALALLVLAAVALPAQGTVTIVRAGSGSGTVKSVPPGAINCPSDCSETLAAPGTITIAAGANSGSTFAGWSGGGCAGTTPCVVRVTGNRTVTATFNTAPPPPPSFALTVTAIGAGTVTSVPPGIACSGATCTHTFGAGSVRLVAAPRPDAIFMGYTGGGCGTAPVCLVSLSAPTTVTATFRLPTLVVTLGGDATGRVTSSPGTIRCTRTGGTGCSEQFRQGDVVALTASSTTGTFTGWTGACAPSGTTPTCSVRMTAQRTVGATFTRPVLRLSLSEGTTIAGSTISTGGAPCARSCSESHLGGTPVVVRPTTGTSGTGRGVFLGWTVTGVTTSSGGAVCTSSGSCRFTMPLGPVAVAARFGRPTLTLVKDGTGSGSTHAVGARFPNGNPLRCGLECAGTVSAPVDSNLLVTLRDTADARPVNPSGLTAVASVPAVCSANDCPFRVAANTRVTSTFTRLRAVRITVTGEGIVDGLVGGASCTRSGGGGCRADLPPGTRIVLTGRDTDGVARRTWTISPAPTPNPCATGGETCTLTMPSGSELSVRVDFQ